MRSSESARKLLTQTLKRVYQTRLEGSKALPGCWRGLGSFPGEGAQDLLAGEAVRCRPGGGLAPTQKTPGPSSTLAAASCGMLVGSPLASLSARPRALLLPPSSARRDPRLVRAFLCASASPAFPGGSSGSSNGSSSSRRSFASGTPPWWGSLREEGDGGDPAARPPAPLSDQPGVKQKRELHAVNTAVAVNVAIFFAKVAAWMVTSSG